METQELQELMQSAWIVLPTGSLIYNRQGQAILANSAIRKYFGLTVEEIYTMREHYNLFTDPSFIRAGLIPAIEAAFRGTKSTSQTIDYVPMDVNAQPTNRVMKIQISFSPLRVNNTVGDYIVSYFEDKTEEIEMQTALEQREKALQRAAEHQDLLQAEIEARSTPVVPVLPGILVLPLVGAIDSVRAQDVLSSVLDAASNRTANSLILDITGVPVVDTAVANYLLQMVRALKLLGTETIMVGISPEIAQTVVQLGLRLEDITTRADLQSGLQTALQRQGLKIVKA